MPRSKKGVKRPSVDVKQLEEAIHDVLIRKLSTRVAARIHGISKTTLLRHLKEHCLSRNPQFKYNSQIKVKQIFTDNEESSLVNYLKIASRLHYGLTKRETMILAYQFAKENDKKVPDKWHEDSQAGKEWIRGFLHRHKTLSLRKPEPTSLARSTSFSKKNVSEFFTNLRECLSRGIFEPSKIFNLDETGNSTVHTPPKVIATKGDKQVGSMTSGERGVNVTMISAVNAVGNHVPPMLIFPRVHFKDHMLKGAPPGSIGGCNPFGWSSEDLFIQYLNHFINHVKPTKENMVLLILDNHDTHISIPAINLAKNNGIVLLTLPPHTSHKLQPLDRTVFGPYKAYYNQAAAEWMLMNPGKPMGIYDIAEIVGKAYPKAFTNENIAKGFTVTGIWPLNENIFSEHEFLTAYVTDRPFEPIIDNITSDQISVDATTNDLVYNEPRPSTSFKHSLGVSPEMIRPYPKAPPRKARGGRQKGKTRILTDTPEKEDIESKKLKRIKPKPKTVKKFSLQNSSEEESSDVLILDESSDENEFVDSLIESYTLENKEKEEDQVSNEITKGDFVLIELKGKKSKRHYVAEVLGSGSDGYEVKYFRRIFNTNKFLPNDEDIFEVCEGDIVTKLPRPITTGASERQLSHISFPVDFLTYNI